MTTRRRVWQWRHGQRLRRPIDNLAAEEPLEIQIDTRPVVVTMRTPGHDDELAAGFLLTEGLIARPTDIVRIQHHPRSRSGNVIQVFLAPTVPVDFSRLTRHVYVASSCGLCGKASIDAVHRHFPRLPMPRRPRLPLGSLFRAAKALPAAQTTFAKTGGLHAAAVADADGRLVVLREDVGRHNAVDKVLGHAALHRLLPLDQHILLVSGRASFEIVQKALAARIPIIAAVSAPSSLAVEFAARSGQTLVGFLREDRLNVYSHAGRITGLARSVR